MLCRCAYQAAAGKARVAVYVGTAVDATSQCGSDDRHPSPRSTFLSLSRSLMSFVDCCAIISGSVGCRLAKLTKQHGLPLWENAGAGAVESDAESSGRPVRPHIPHRCAA